jgi:hypothetical protein
VPDSLELSYRALAALGPSALSLTIVILVSCAALAFWKFPTYLLDFLSTQYREAPSLVGAQLF